MTKNVRPVRKVQYRNKIDVEHRIFSQNYRDHSSQMVSLKTSNMILADVEPK